MRLQRLTGLEREKIVAEFKEVLALISKLQEILGSEKLVLDIIVDELQTIKKQFGDERRTQIVAEASDIDIEDLIVEEDMVITVSRGGYIKRSPLSLYRAQRRGGKGRIGATTKEEDVVEHLFVASTHAFILAFTNRGRMHWIKVYDLPQLGSGDARQGHREPAEPRAQRADRRHGRDQGLPRGPVPRLRHAQRPRSRRPPSSAYSNVRSGGIIAINVEDGDELLSVRITGGADQIFIGTRQGQGIRFSGEGRSPDGPRHDGRHRRRVARRTTTRSSRWTSSTRRRPPALRDGEAATASARRSPSTASRAAAARASSTSRSRRRTARSSGSSP